MQRALRLRPNRKMTLLSFGKNPTRKKCRNHIQQTDNKESDCRTREQEKKGKNQEKKNWIENMRLFNRNKILSAYETEISLNCNIVTQWMSLFDEPVGTKSEVSFTDHFR